MQVPLPGRCYRWLIISVSVPRFIPHLSGCVPFWATFAYLACLGLSAVEAAPLPRESPQKFASRFYKTHQQLNFRGIPNAEERRRFSVYLSLELLALFATADRQRMDFPETDSKGNLLKPPWCEGDYFASRSEEGIDAFSVGKVRTNRKRIIVPVRVTEDNLTWTEELILLPTSQAGSSPIFSPLPRRLLSTKTAPREPSNRRNRQLRFAKSCVMESRTKKRSGHTNIE